MSKSAKYEPMMNLKILRIKKGLTQAELAERVGVCVNAIGQYECGITFPRRQTLNLLARALDCNVQELL